MIPTDGRDDILTTPSPQTIPLDCPSRFYNGLHFDESRMKMSLEKSNKTELNTSHLDHVPGTEILFDDLSHQTTLPSPQHQLKSRAKGNAQLLLVPQPAPNNPNDPLRWSRRKKAVVFFNGCWFAFMGAVTGPIMAAGLSTNP